MVLGTEMKDRGPEDDCRRLGAQSSQAEPFILQNLLVAYKPGTEQQYPISSFASGMGTSPKMKICSSIEADSWKWC